MNAAEALEALAAIGLRGQLRRTGHPDWQRIFIIDARGVTQGRISIHCGAEAGIKWYVSKVSGYGRVLEDERLPAAWNLWTQRRERLTVERWNIALQRAIQAAQAERDEKQAARDALPPLGLNARGIQKTRKPLQLNVRKHLHSELFGVSDSEKAGPECTNQSSNLSSR